MHRILRLLTAFVFPDEYLAGILAMPKPHKAACSILLCTILLGANMPPRCRLLRQPFEVPGIMPGLDSRTEFIRMNSFYSRVYTLTLIREQKA